MKKIIIFCTNFCLVFALLNTTSWSFRPNPPASNMFITYCPSADTDVRLVTLNLLLSRMRNTQFRLTCQQHEIIMVVKNRKAAAEIDDMKIIPPIDVTVKGNRVLICLKIQLFEFLYVEPLTRNCFSSLLGRMNPSLYGTFK